MGMRSWLAIGLTCSSSALARAQVEDRVVDDASVDDAAVEETAVEETELPSGSADTQIAYAVSLFERYELAEAEASFDETVRRGGLSRAGLARVYMYLVVVQSALGQLAEADASLIRAASLGAEGDLPRGAPPSMRERFRELRERYAESPWRLELSTEGMRLQIRAEDETDHIARIRVRAGSFDRELQALSHVVLDDNAFEGQSNHAEVDVRAYDSHGNELLSATTTAERAPRPSLAEAPIEDGPRSRLGIRLGISLGAVALVCIVLGLALGLRGNDPSEWNSTPELLGP